MLKTLGFSGGRILRLVLGESLLLAVLGGLPGLALAMLVTIWLRPGVSNLLPGFALTGGIVTEAIGLMLALGVITGLIPALNAMRLKIATALARG